MVHPHYSELESTQITIIIYRFSYFYWLSPIGIRIAGILCQVPESREEVRFQTISFGIEPPLQVGLRYHIWSCHIRRWDRHESSRVTRWVCLPQKAMCLRDFSLRSKLGSGGPRTFRAGRIGRRPDTGGWGRREHPVGITALFSKCLFGGWLLLCTSKNIKNTATFRVFTCKGL